MFLLSGRRLLVENRILNGQHKDEGEKEPISASVGRLPVALVGALQAGLHGEADGAPDLGLTRMKEALELLDPVPLALGQDQRELGSRRRPRPPSRAGSFG